MCNRLQTLQNRAVRVVTSSSYDRRSVEILDELGWDNLETRRTRQLATIMYKLKYHIAPDHLSQIFKSTNSMYFYNLRNSTHNSFVPRPYTEAGKHSFHYREGGGGGGSLELPVKTVKRQTDLGSFFLHL